MSVPLTADISHLHWSSDLGIPVCGDTGHAMKECHCAKCYRVRALRDRVVDGMKR